MLLFLKNLAFIVLVPGTMAVFLPLVLFKNEGLLLEGFRVIGLLPLLAGAVILLRCIWEFGKTGRGTPAPIDPPKVLVVQSMYRYVRNPMYIGALLLIVGEAIIFASWQIVLYAICFAIMVHLFVVLYEEPKLRLKFGSTYEEYIHDVPRWIPGTGRKKSSHTNMS